jgi:hypothetical protein
MALENYGTIWVCENCMRHHANGECGDCHRDEGHDQEPLSVVQAPFTVSLSVSWEEHHDGCLRFILGNLNYSYREMEWPSLPGDYECDCEVNTYSSNQCEGCATWLHGPRYGMTLFKQV